MSFFRATSDTLPMVDIHMVLSYLRSSPSFSSAEIKGVKASRASKAEYGDKAIGWVELRREERLCHVRAKITPEHKVRTKPYMVTATVNERLEEIVSAQCLDCAASEGGCKHAVAFLFWLHRRSEEPSPTEVISYWRRSSLSTVGNLKNTTINKYLKIKEPNIPPPRCDLLQKAITFFSGRTENMISLNYRDLSDSPAALSLNHLIIEYKYSTNTHTSEGFLEFCIGKMSQELCTAVEEATREQSECKLWSEIRFGRVTASNIWACSRHRRGESLMDSLLGAGKPIRTPAVLRGKALEPQVIRCLSEMLNVPLKKCGIFLSNEYPWLGASPDAICDRFVVEVKCPAKSSNMSRYIKDGDVTPNFKAQVQLQMLLTGRTEGLFAVLDPTSEETMELNMRWLTLNRSEIIPLIESTKLFWSSNVYPELINMY